MPSFLYQGKIVCGIAGFKAHCALWFWKGETVVGRKPAGAMGNFGRITTITDLPSATALKAYVRNAVALVEVVPASAGAHDGIAGFIAKYTPELGRSLEDCRARMRAFMPRGYELVYDNYNALVFGYGPSERTSSAPLSLAAYPRWVTLFFLQGAALEDPLRLLEGSASRVRSVRLRSAADLDKPAIVALVKQAMQPRASEFAAAPPIRTVVKSVSARQRPRRP
jgi:hypothetical protein